MGIKVCKFGGTSMADASSVRQVAKIVLSDPDRKFVVVSAPGKRFSGDEKITDLLYKSFGEAQANDEKKSFSKVCERFLCLEKELGVNADVGEFLADIEERIRVSENPDYAASRGEFLSAKILAKYLGFEFVDPADFVKFSMDGSFNSEFSNDLASKILKRISGGAVIPGFYGSDDDGNVKTFSRGGSDITGAVVARAVGADVYENWTDVDGFLSADPRIVEHPKLMKSLTYTELRELAYMGANVLHPESIFPVRLAGIPINIKNTFNPDSPGTMILPDDKADAQSAVVTGIAGKTGLVALNISKQMMNAEVGFSRKLLSVLEQCGISYEHLPSGVDSLSLVISGSEIGGKMEKVINRIRSAVNPDSISVQGELSLVAVVGKNMKNTRGTGAKALTALADAGISVRMIDQGASEINIILGVDTCDYKRAVNAVYQAFFK